MTSAEIQLALDTAGVVRLPDDSALSVPIFLDGLRNDGTHGRASVVGPGSVHAASCRTACVVGLRRGKISGDHYTAEGYRTRGDSHLILSGGTADLGPSCRWSSVASTLKIELQATSHAAGQWSGARIPLVGIQGREPDATGSTYRPWPSPWLIYFDSDNGPLRVAIRLADDVVRIFSAPVPRDVPDLNLTVWIDLANREVRCLANGVDYTMSPLGTHPAWPEGSRLAGNTHAPLGVGWFRVCGGGYWGAEGPHHDFTVRELILSADGSQFGRLYPREPRPESYSGAKSLPLVMWMGDGICLAIHQSQTGETDSSREITMRDVRVWGGRGPGIWIGGVMGLFRMDGVSVQGGCTRGVHCSGLGVVYRLAIRGLWTETVWDCGVHLRHTFGATIDGGSIAGARCGIDLFGGKGSVRDVFVPPSIDQESLVSARGGNWTIADLDGDWEIPTTIPAIHLRPDWVEGPNELTALRAIRCTNGWDANNVVQQIPKPAGYTGRVMVSIQ